MRPLLITSIQIVAAASLGFLGVVFAGSIIHPTAPAVLALAAPTCVIKGNISIATGERIYHLPGHHWYNETVISPQYGERYFCSEAEAKRFAASQMASGTEISAGTLNPVTPKRIVKPSEIEKWLSEKA